MIPLIGGAPANEAERRCFGRVRVAFGIPFTADAIAQWRKRFAVQWAGGGGYGLTEAAKISELTVAEEAAGAACGKPCSFEVRIFGANDEECAPGQPGEIVVRPLRPGIMFDGYWRRPADTLQAMRDLWFHTGDIGKFDQNGNLVFVDRKKDYIRCGGENISSYEIETALRRHPAILDVAAYAVPSALAEDEVKVSVILKPDSAITAGQLCLWAIERLPYFCVPHYIEIHQDFPRSPTGKVLKYLLKEAGVTARSWVRASSGVSFLRK
jgi:crotonobetaine/carnitine-CoA ligase